VSATVIGRGCRRRAAQLEHVLMGQPPTPAGVGIPFDVFQVPFGFQVAIRRDHCFAMQAGVPGQARDAGKGPAGIAVVVGG
jgi:hypothetical protein